MISIQILVNSHLLSVIVKELLTLNDTEIFQENLILSNITLSAKPASRILFRFHATNFVLFFFISDVH